MMEWAAIIRKEVKEDCNIRYMEMFCNLEWDTKKLSAIKHKGLTRKGLRQTKEAK